MCWTGTGTRAKNCTATAAQCLHKFLLMAIGQYQSKDAIWSYILCIFQSGGWGLTTTHSCHQFWRSKTNSNSTQFIELYCGILGQTKPSQPIGKAAEFKFESKFKPLPTSACHLAITPEGYSRRQLNVLTAKSMANLLGQRSSTGWASLTGEHKHRVFPGLL